MNRILFVLFVCFVDYSTACNGYSIKVSKYKNCVENPIIKLPEKGFAITLDKDCNLYGTGCVKITKGFKTAKATYHAKKPPLPVIEGDFDFCQVQDLVKGNTELSKGIEAFGIPNHCPVSTNTICGGPEKSINLGKYKNQVGMAAGNTELKLEVEHDVGKSCMEVNFSLSKPRKG